MADFEAIIRKHVGEDGNIPTSAINTIVTAIKTAVGNEFVEKDRYKNKLTEIESLKEQVQTAEDNATTAEKWKTKYEAIKSDFADYKKEISTKETRETKKNAYRELLKEVGISEKRLESVLKVSGIDEIELDDKGKIKDADKLKSAIKDEWADFITTESKHGADVNNPPENNPHDKPANSRAAQLARQFTAARYGEVKQESNNE